jgi:GNAT acetyltransferase
MSLPDSRRLWVMQLRLERKTLDDSGRMVRIPGDNPDDIPACAVTRFADGCEWAFNGSAGDELIQEAQRVPSKEFFAASALLTKLLNAHGLSLQRFTTYCFTSAGDHPAGPAVVVRNGPEEFAVVVDGREVSWASSSRSNDECAELWVRTDPGYQRRGYARQAATAWAAEVLGSGRVPFYSHLADNDPSRRLAANLGVTHLFDVAALTAPDT